MCTALAILMSRAGEQIGLIDGDMRAGRTELAVERLGMHFLSGGETKLLPDPRRSRFPGKAALILAGDFLAPLSQIELMLDEFAARAGSITLLQVLDPAEIEFPFSGRIIFTDPADGARHPVENAEAINAQYRERIAEHLKGLEALCRRTGAKRILHRTDASLSPALLEAWRLISPETIHAAGGRV
jgi:hypothetical protein